MLLHHQPISQQHTLAKRHKVVVVMNGDDYDDDCPSTTTSTTTTIGNCNNTHGSGSVPSVNGSRQRTSMSDDDAQEVQQPDSRRRRVSSNKLIAQQPATVTMSQQQQQQQVMLCSSGTAEQMQMQMQMNNTQWSALASTGVPSLQRINTSLSQQEEEVARPTTKGAKLPTKPHFLTPTLSPSAPASLVLSSLKLFRYGKFWMRLSLRESCRTMMNLSTENVMNCGYAAKVCRMGKPQAEVTCTNCSPDKPVVHVVSSMPVTALPNGIEQYVFVLRSNCTSSRDHLKSQLVMEVSLGPNLCVVSPPFVLRARRKSSKRSRSCQENSPRETTEAMPANAAADTILQEESQRALPSWVMELSNEPPLSQSPPTMSSFASSPPMGLASSPQVCGVSPSPAMGAAVAHLLGNTDATSPMKKDESAAVLPPPALSLGSLSRGQCLLPPVSSLLSVLPTIKPVLQQPPQRITKQMQVELQEIHWKLVFFKAKPLLVRIPGIVDVDYNYCSIGQDRGMVTVSTTGTSVVELAQCLQTLSLFLSNLIPLFPNPFNLDLISTGVVLYLD